MFKHLLLATTLVVATTPAFAMTDAECAALWGRTDVYAAGKLVPAYAQAVAKSGRTITADGTIDQTGFMAACKADVFMAVAMAPEAGAPFPGANSFTEAQAIDRIEKAGFTAVAALKKDDQGIWRGSAKKGDKAVAVALDFKGNVVAN